MTIEFKQWMPGHFVGMQFSKIEQKEMGIVVDDMPEVRIEAMAKIAAVIANSAIRTAMKESKKPC